MRTARRPGGSPPGNPPLPSRPPWSRPPLEQAPPWEQTPLGPGTPPLWTEFLTHACENITLPQTSFAGGKKKKTMAITRNYRKMFIGNEGIRRRCRPMHFSDQF